MQQFAVLAATAFLLTAAAVAWQAVRMDAKHRYGRSLDEPVDVAIVLGAAIEPDGMLRFASRRRVIAGVELLRTGRARRLIMAGGGYKGFPTPVGELMRAHAVSLGADADAILVEGRSRSTLENLAFALPMARDLGAQRIAVVTDQHHMTRALWLARALGHRDVLPVSAPGLESARRFDRLYEVCREALAWWWNLGKIAGLLLGGR